MLDESDNAGKEIYELANKGIINGYQDGTFRPQNQISRLETAILFYRSLGLKGSPYKGYFKDVQKDGNWTSIIEATKDVGIFKGDNGRFNPGQLITREQMASVIVRAFDLKEVQSSPVNLSDLHTVLPVHKKDVEILYQNGITIGHKDGKYSPKDGVTRAEFCTLLESSVTRITNY